MNNVFVLAKNFGNAIINHASDGFKKVTNEEFENRLNICKGCDQFDANEERCKNCGCFLKYKAAWNSEKCPLSKW